MSESFSPEQGKEDMKEYRREFFEEMKRNTRVFSDAEYQKVFTPVTEYYGVNSPAFILSEDFLETHPYPDSIPNDIDRVLIAINGESVPDPDYIQYLKTHEYWELYITSKDGFNLGRQTENDFHLPIIEQERPSHRYAILKEFQAAEKDGKLDEYMQWWREYYQADIERIQALPEEEIQRISKHYGDKGSDRNMIIQFIQKNLGLKESVHHKIVSKRKK